MTGHYTHTRPEAQRLQIEQALGLWPESIKFIHSFTKGIEE